MDFPRAGVLSLLTLAIIGCSKKDGDDITIVNSLFRGELGISADGGTGSPGPAGVGGRGGSIDVSAAGNIFAGINPPPIAPVMPSAPVTGTLVTSWTDTQTIASGNALINGSIVAATTGSTATLNVNTGDLVINGTLTSADNGIFETNVELNVLAGTVWILGTIRTGRVDGVANADQGGLVTINALRIFFAGTIEARGEDGSAGIGGGGGDVTFDTGAAGAGQTSQLLLGGTMNLAGGNATGPSASGGSGGSFFSYGTFSSNGTVQVQGTTFQCGGGSASGPGSVIGGNGGLLDLQADAGVFFNATFSAAGGGGSSTTGSAEGGTGGFVRVNQLAVADSGPIALFGSITVAGGAASSPSSAVAVGGNAGGVDVVGGSDVNLGDGTFSLRGADATANGGEGGSAFFSAGVFPGFAGDLHYYGVIDVSDGSGAESSQGSEAGTIDFDTTLGDIHFSGSLIANGGHGSNEFDLLSGPSEGGFIGAQTGDAGGSITIRGTLQANGGSDSNSADDNDGARGGIIQLLCTNAAGSIYLEPGSSIQARGGNAAGGSSAPFGGDGGLIELLTAGGSVADGIVGGNINMRGTIEARGGAGLGFAGSFGGFGGEILVDSDSLVASAGGADGRGGDITLNAGATIDASGGPAGSGGDGLNDGAPGVSSPIAVIFDADGDDSDDPAENGVISNLGIVIARGTGAGAFGGDVLFDGLDSLLVPGPLPGFQDRFGDGDAGDFLSQ